MNDLFNIELVLENERARLEPLTEEHFAQLWPVAAEKEIWEFTSAKINSEKDFRVYFDTALRERKNKTAYPFAIYDKREKRYAGCTRYGNISFENKKVEIGWTWYHPQLQATGLNRSCKFLLLQYGFENLLLNRIELKTSFTNTRSQNAIAKLGATREGILRKHMINDDGTVRDTVFFSIVDDEWPRLRNTVFREY